jgi:hypothetical protein
MAKAILENIYHYSLQRHDPRLKLSITNRTRDQNELESGRCNNNNAVYDATRTTPRLIPSYRVIFQGLELAPAEVNGHFAGSHVSAL